MINVSILFSSSFYFFQSIFLEDDHVERKVLHEVHSGTNPISNSLPQQRWKPKLRGSPQLLRSP